MNHREMEELRRRCGPLLESSPNQAWLKLSSGELVPVDRVLEDRLGTSIADSTLAKAGDFFPAIVNLRFRQEDRLVRMYGKPAVFGEPPLIGATGSWSATLKIPVGAGIREGATLGFAYRLDALETLDDAAGANRATEPDFELSTPARARHYADRCFLGTCRTGEIAQALNRHPTHVATCFRRQYGVTIAQYIRARRVAWVAHRLSTTDWPVSDIALQAGFCDQSHLTHAFRDVLHTTPGVYRRDGQSCLELIRQTATGSCWDASP